MRTEQKRHRCRVLSLILIGALVLGFHPRESLCALSPEEEKVLGDQFLDTIQKRFDFVGDDFAEDYLNDIGRHLLKSVEAPLFSFHFYLVKEGSLNAFAGPGGHVFVFSGLIEAMDGADELGAVLCHELAHVSARHIAGRFEQGKKIALATLAGILAGAFVGGKAGGAIATGSVAASIQTQLSYSREDERQADQMGFKYMDSAGFDPSAMIVVMKKLERSQLGGEGIPPYLLTHPGGPERISNTEVLLNGYQAKPEEKEGARYRTLFPLFKTVVRARATESREAERFFQQELERQPNASLAHFGLGIVWKERSENAKAVEHFEMALRGQPDSVPILRNIGEAYQLMGQDREAIPLLERALRIDTQDKASLFLLANSYMNLEEHGKAIVMYERLISQRPVKDEVYHSLGVAYGRENRLALAHYNFGIYFKRQRQTEKARFHFLKAEELSANNPALKGRIREAMEGLRR